MKCENCGAEYRLGDVRCPFCGSENMVLAEVRKERVLKQYDQEARQLKDTVRQKTIKRWEKILLVICGSLAGIALLAGIVIAVLGPIRARRDYQTRERQAQEMEALLDEQGLEGLCQYIQHQNVNISEFPKFRELWYMYREYCAFQDSIEFLDECQELFGQDREDEMREALEERARLLTETACQTMQDCRQYSRDRVIMGTETYFEEYYELCCGWLRERGISQKLLTWMSLEQENKQKDPRFQEIVDRVADSYMEFPDR